MPLPGGPIRTQAVDGQAGQRSTAASAAPLDFAGRKSASASPTACGRSSSSWHGAGAKPPDVIRLRTLASQRATRASAQMRVAACT